MEKPNTTRWARLLGILPLASMAAMGLMAVAMAAWCFFCWDNVCFNYYAYRYRHGDYGCLWQVDDYCCKHAVQSGMTEDMIVHCLGPAKVLSVDEARADFRWVRTSFLKPAKNEDDGAEHVLRYSTLGPPEQDPIPALEDVSACYFLVRDGRIADYHCKCVFAITP